MLPVVFNETLRASDCERNREPWQQRRATGVLNGAKCGLVAWRVFGAFAFAVTTPLPANCAEIKSMPLLVESDPRTGTVELSAGEQLTPQKLERAVRADAAGLWQRTDGGAGLSVRLEGVIWSDGSLGCRVPHRLYTDVPVPGWRAILSDGTRELSYHASSDGRWVLCPAHQAQAPVPER
ncbi:MAG: hypothetical protein WBC37_10510 [Burkholderiaceae bacterium]